MENYIPKIHENGEYIEMLIRGMKCPKCNRIMINEDKKRYSQQIFPYYFRLNQEAQMKKVNIVYKSQIKVDDNYICVECEKEGKADFLCCLCNKRKSLDKKERSIGDPAEFLCTDCYKTVPANIWCEKEIELGNKHRWDFD